MKKILAICLLLFGLLLDTVHAQEASGYDIYITYSTNALAVEAAQQYEGQPEVIVAGVKNNVLHLYSSSSSVASSLSLKRDALVTVKVRPRSCALCFMTCRRALEYFSALFPLLYCRFALAFPQSCFP